MLSINYFKSHPLRIAKDQRHQTIGQVLQAEKSGVHASKMDPQAGAYIHYGGVELGDRLAILQPDLSQSELKELTTLWYLSCGQTAKQILFYVMRICPKELRHGSPNSCDKAFGDGDYDQDAVAMCKAILSSDYSGVLADHNNAHVKIGDFFDCVEQHFRHGGWGGAFGGKKWADIALEFKRYIDGESSALIAADRCWSLVHNTGPIFNKGFYFHNNTSDLMNILNNQHSGSVFDMGPDYLDKFDHPTSHAFKAFMSKAVAAIKKADPDYMLGQTGGVSADGGKPVTTGGDSDTGSQKDGTTVKKVGPYKIKTTTSREEA